MRYLVFSQAAKDSPQEALLVERARTFFKTDLRFTRRWHPDEMLREGNYLLQVTLPNCPSAELSAMRRLATEEDWLAAEEAERIGQATGMATLARRCKVIWEIPVVEHFEAEVMTICGVLAATELGPVLPPDHSTLYGVRGARLRADSALQERKG